MTATVPGLLLVEHQHLMYPGYLVNDGDDCFPRCVIVELGIAQREVGLQNAELHAFRCGQLSIAEHYIAMI